MKKIYSTIIIFITLFLGNNTLVKAQNDLGDITYSTHKWDHFSSYLEGTVNEYYGHTIALTTDKKIFVWGDNQYSTIHTKKIGGGSFPNKSTYQMVPYFVPTPAGEVAKKVGVTGINKNINGGTDPGSTTFRLPTFVCLMESGKLYGWGYNYGLMNGANPTWPALTVAASTYEADTTKAKRVPVPLTIGGETTFVDFDMPAKKDWWIAIGASGKAYHIGRSTNVSTTTFSTVFTAIPNPAGVSAATFKYVAVWTAKTGDLMIYLKGNDGKIYYTGRMSTALTTAADAVPTPSFWTAIETVTALPTNETNGEVLTIIPKPISFPTGEDIVKIEVGNNLVLMALSASGKAYGAGMWRRGTNNLLGGVGYNFPLKTPISAPNPLIYRDTDSTLYLKSFAEMALPSGANKMIDICNTSFGVSGQSFSTLVIGDNYRAYQMGKVYAGDNYNNLEYPADLGGGFFDCLGSASTLTSSSNQWIVEAVRLRNIAKAFFAVAPNTIIGTAAFPGTRFFISKSGRGYQVAHNTQILAPFGIIISGYGKANMHTILPIANEQLDSCSPVLGSAGPLAITPSIPAAGVIDCSKTQLSPAPTVGTATQLDLIVTINVTTAGTFTPITVSGSGMTVANGVTSVTTTTTGIQTFHIPMKYDGTALGTLNFTIGSAGSCSADLSTNKKKVISEVWTLDNCTLQPIAPNLK